MLLNNLRDSYIMKSKKVLVLSRYVYKKCDGKS